MSFRQLQQDAQEPEAGLIHERHALPAPLNRPITPRQCGSSCASCTEPSRQFRYIFPTNQVRT
jgi:hypothetical protein